MKLLSKSILALSLVALSSGVTASVHQSKTLEEALAEITPPVEEVEVVEEVVEEPPVVMVKRWVLPGGTSNESTVLSALQDRGISDRAALATVMGNIKQESRFLSNICEGGARIAYGRCHRGGYGLIQWTTHGRYNGLGRHARNIGHDPSSVEAQVSYLFTEVEWKSIEGALRRGGGTIQYYMSKAYRWLGWGHHGYRTDYSHQYYSKLVLKEVPAK